MSGNIFGQAFRVMTFGESHGPYIGLVIDGIKPNLPIDTRLIQAELDRRRPAQSQITTTRREKDQAEIISGIFEGKTTGTPICMLIKNEDQWPSDYGKLRKILRPGHAAYSFLKKYGIFDYRGGGRASGRETATRVAAGAVAKQFLNQKGITVTAHTCQIGNVRSTDTDFLVIDQNNVRAADLKAAKKMEEEIERVKGEGDSIGGIVEIAVQNCPVGIGEPVFDKLEADLAKALMSIGAVKGFEIGAGFQAAAQKGSEHNDVFYYDEGSKNIRTKTNNSGGVLGGISNGEDLIMRIAVKPPSSIRKKQKTINLEGEEIEFQIDGRHDPCICPRIVPVAEAMVALVILDHILMQQQLLNANEIHSRIKMIDTQLLLLLAARANLRKKTIPNSKNERSKSMREWMKFASELGLNGEFANKVKDLVDDTPRTE
jgi:chorismate synthase